MVLVSRCEWLVNRGASAATQVGCDDIADQDFVPQLRSKFECCAGRERQENPVSEVRD